MPDQLRHRVTHSHSNATPHNRKATTKFNTTMDKVDNDDNDSCCSSHSSNSNLSNGSANSKPSGNFRRHNKQLASKKQGGELEHIDEEQGYDHYELTSLLRSNSKDGSSSPNKQHHQQSGRPINKKYQMLKPGLKHKNPFIADNNNCKMGADTTRRDHDADNTKNNSESDRRSKALFLKTAFWITCWYGTSLATLFLNKIILSRPGSSVHVLGMCQMTTAAVLGGWSTFGGADYVYDKAIWLYRCLPDAVQCRVGLNVGGGKERSSRVGGGNNLGRKGSELTDSEGVGSPTKGDQSSSGTPSKQGADSATSSGYSFHFVRDMSIVGVLRGLTVVLGLIALEHVPVSFVETIKSTAPAFTVVFAKLILQERTATPVMLTLIPIVAGLILCSASELRFDTIGFVAAVMNNCADCVQNVMSKRMLAHLKPTQLQFYTSVAALALQSPFVVRDATGLIRKWIHPMGDPDMEDMLMPEENIIPNTEDDHVAIDGGSLHHGMSLTKLLIIDAIFYHLQSVSAYCTMGCMSPVSQSVANTLKRALLVWASILYFGNPVTNSGILGIIMVVSGVFLYNHVRRIYQS